MTLDRYLEAFDIAARAFRPKPFARALAMEEYVAVYMMVGHGLSIADAVNLSGWSRDEVVRMCTEVDQACARDAAFNDKVAKLVRVFAAQLSEARS